MHAKASSIQFGESRYEQTTEEKKRKKKEERRKRKKITKRQKKKKNTEEEEKKRGGGIPLFLSYPSKFLVFYGSQGRKGWHNRVTGLNGLI